MDDECNIEAAEEEFTGPEAPEDGLGPIFNAAGCGECHLVPTLGGGSQIMEKRAGLFQNGVFTEHHGGSLIQDRALLEFAPQELVTHAKTNVVAFRASLPLFGIGFVEAHRQQRRCQQHRQRPASRPARAAHQRAGPRDDRARSATGRFGWKDQQASLVSFSADAYVNEMGITSPLQPDEPTSNGTTSRRSGPRDRR